MMSANIPDRISKLCSLRMLWCLFCSTQLVAEIKEDELTSVSYRQAIERLDPMETEGLNSNLAYVLKKYYEWTFESADTWERVQSLRFDGILTLPNGSARFVAFKKKPDYSKVVLLLPGDARMVMAYDGEDAWTINTALPGAQPSAMPKEEARDFIRDATASGHLLYPIMIGKQIDMLGMADVEERTCYKLVVTLPSGDRMVSYLDTSNFAERKQTVTNSLTGAKEHTTFSDFRRIEGVRFPFASIKEVEGEWVHRVEIKRIQLNLGIMPWMFQRPSGAYIPGESEMDDSILTEELPPIPEAQDWGGSAFPDRLPKEDSALENLDTSLF